MTKLQRAYSLFFSLCLAGTLLLLPGQFFFFPYPEAGTASERPFLPPNVYRLLPLYSYLEKQYSENQNREDMETLRRIIEANKVEAPFQINQGDVYEGTTEREESEIAKEGENSQASIKNVQNFREEHDMAKEGENSTGSKPDAKEKKEKKTDKKTKNGSEGESQENLKNDRNPERKSIYKNYQEVFASAPQAVFSSEQLTDYSYLMDHFFIVDENTATNEQQINAIRFLEEDLSIKKDTAKPQILIYHSHSQETFADSREGCPEDTVVGIGNYLTELLSEQYGYQVLHVTEAFDLFDGELDRSRAYDAARAFISRILEENPSIQVVIDLHRDGVPEDRRLVTLVNGKETAQILFYNGLSYTLTQGSLSYLPNPYIQQNLAFSFQLNYQAEQYFPGFSRGIYLAGLRYNLHLSPRALLLEAGAQTNTIQEVKNAMEPFAAILARVLE